MLLGSSARRIGAGEPSSSPGFLLRFLLSEKICRSSASLRSRVARLPWVPPGLAGLAMLNWLGFRSRALDSLISRTSFSRFSRFFFCVSVLMRRSRRVLVRALCSRFAVSVLKVWTFLLSWVLRSYSF